MPRFASVLYAICLITIIIIIGACQSAPPPPPTAVPPPTAAPQPTAVPQPTAAPKAAAPTVITASGKAATSQPAQPTVPPIPTKAVTPFVTATFAPRVLVEPTPAAASKTSGTAPTGAAGGAPAAPAGPQAPGVATGRRSEVKVEFVDPLSTAEQVDDLSLNLRRIAGILDVSGNEIAITIGYDAGLILPNQIGAQLASMGHPIKPLP